MSSETIVFEAEDLALDDFYVVNGSQASGGQLIKICGDDATAETDFNFASGYYDVTIWIQDENDGQSVIELVIDGLVVGTIVLDQDDDGGGSDNGGFSAFTLDNVLVEDGSHVELRAHRDGGEYVRIDKIEFDHVGDIGGGSGAPAGGVQTLMTETFEGRGKNLEKSSNVLDSDFERQNNTALTDGNDDGQLLFRSVDLSGHQNAKLTIDAKVVKGGFEAWGHNNGDMVRFELIDQDGTVHVLDQFSGWGNSMTGSVTGQVIDKGGFDGLSWDIPAGLESAQLRIVSDISANGEKLAFDNLVITAETAPEGGGTGGSTPVTVTLDAVNDTFRIGEAEDISANLLDNDTTDAVGPMTVTSVNPLGLANDGTTATVDQPFSVTTEGGRTGSVTVNADGTFTFDGGDNFSDLTQGQTDSFQFEYTVRVPAEEQAKHNLLFVLDISNSTVNGAGNQEDVFVGAGVGDVNGDGLADTVLDAQIAGVVAAVNNLLAKGADPSKIDIGVVTFSGQASGYTNIDAETLGTFGLDAQGLMTALTGIESGGWTNYEAGLQQARDWFAAQQGDDAVNKMYFLSDGRPAIGYQNGQYIYQDENDYGDEVAAIANTHGAEIHAIGVGANSDLAYLNDLDNTDGAEQVLDTTSLTAMLEDTTSVLVEDTATVTVTIDGEGKIIDAVDDHYNVMESETAGDEEGNVLANDDPQTGNLVVEIDGNSGAVGNWIDLAAGGRVKVMADGSVDFDADGDFDALDDGESADVSFSYTIRNEEATADKLVVTFSGGSGFEAMASIEEVNGDLQVTVSVTSEGAADIGDLRGLFFHLADEGLLGGLTVSGGDVTSSAFAANAVSDLGNGVNMNGPFGGFDGGIEFGSQGMSGDDIRETSFTLSHASEALTLDMLQGQEFGLRVTSVGADGGGRGDSLKLGGSAETGSVSTLVDSANVTVTVHGEDTIVTIDAVDDVYSVAETEDVSANILDNDTTSGAGPLSVTALATVDGDGSQTAMNVGESFTVTTAGGRTGTVTVNADGSFSFDGGDNFLDMLDGQTDSFRLAYTASAEGETTVARAIDFDADGLAAGTIVSDQIEGVAISAVRKGQTNENAAMIFDADNPTGGDWDLSQPGEGNVLIITEDFHGHDPDDNWNGGTFFFDFDAPSTVQSLTFLDTEEPAPEVRLYDDAGDLIVTLVGPTTADGGMADMSIGIDGVARMEVELKGSGAITGLAFDEVTTATVIEDTAYVDVVVNGEGVANLLPAAADDVLVTDEMTVASVNLLDNDTAGDGATTIVAIDGGAADGTPFTLTTADGRTATFTLQSDGTLTVDPGAEFETLAKDELREFALSYTISDADGDQSSATVTVTVNGLNEGPLAEDDIAEGTEDVAEITGNVLDNDSDPNGDPLTVVSAGGVAAGTAMAVSGVSSEGRALEGTLTVNADGSYSFVPGAGYEAMGQGETVDFTMAYVISDPHGAEATADLTVTVTGLNEAPEALDDAVADTEAVAEVAGNVLDNDSDPNGDPLTVVSAGGMAAGTALALAATSDKGRPLTGTLIIDADGSYSFVPGPEMETMAEGETVVFAAGYTIADPFGAEASATLSITLGGLNEAPVAVNDVNSVDESFLSVAGNVLSNDSDPNEDAYSDDAISVISAGGVAPDTAIAVTATSLEGKTLSGTLTVQANGSYEFTPGAGFGSMGRFDSVDFTVAYEIEDSHGATDTAELTITVDGLNDPPVATANNYNTAEAQEFSGNLLTEDTGAGVDYDPNDDDFSVVAVRQDGVALGNIGESWEVTTDAGRTGTLTVNTNGGFTFTPGADFADLNVGEKDTLSLSYVIEDENGAQDSASFVIDILGEDGGGGGGGGDPEINVAFVVDASASMFVPKYNFMANGLDINGDGAADTAFDLVYHGLMAAIADLEAKAATLGKTLNIGLIGFDDEANATQTYTGQASLETWGAGTASSMFTLATAGDSDADVGVAAAAEWFSDIQADAGDMNEMVILSEGQFSQGNALSMVADWTTDFDGTVHSRFVGDFFNSTMNEINAIEALSNDAVTPDDGDFKFYGYDMFSTEYALQANDILGLA